MWVHAKREFGIYRVVMVRTRQHNKVEKKNLVSSEIWVLRGEGADMK
jgi:hypothetical protein